MPGPDLELMRAYETHLDPAHPTAGDIAATIVGYGEISAVLKFADAPDYVFKRMSGMQSAEDVERFVRVIEDYCQTLASLGVNVVETQCHTVETPHNGRVVYLVQPAMDPDTIGNQILRNASDDELRALLRVIFRHLQDVYERNTDPAGLLVALDAQISNWCWIPNTNGDHHAVYIDVGAPFMRRNGVEQMDFEVFAKSFPGPLAWYFRKFEMQSVIDRYYRLDLVLTDLAGNFIKEGRADRVPLALEEMRTWLSGEGAHLQTTVPTPEKVQKYYDADANIWTYVLALKKFDRFVKTKVLRRPYGHILPGKITRR